MALPSMDYPRLTLTRPSKRIKLGLKRVFETSIEMTIALAATWNPRGELGRFEQLLPRLEELYSHIVISFPPVADDQVVRSFIAGKFSKRPNITVVQNQIWSWGRYIALQKALHTSVSHIHYADMDRLLRWVETRPAEWHKVVTQIEAGDYLIMGRSPQAYATHPQALVRTEAISNRLISQLVGQALDVSAGSKGFSRRAAQFLVDQTQPGKALGTDGAWTILLHRAGFRVDYLEVDGLDWETADRYQTRSANAEQQQALAQAYDQDPAHWAMRVEVALEIVQAGLDAAAQELPGTTPMLVKLPDNG
jgi:hypothetical protein